MKTIDVQWRALRALSETHLGKNGPKLDNSRHILLILRETQINTGCSEHPLENHFCTCLVPTR